VRGNKTIWIYPPYDKRGLPRYVRLKKNLVKKVLPDFKV
jgi:hypothetical protein